MKVEGIVYFTGLAFGLWMMKSFWGIAWFPSIVGLIFAAMGLTGYIMMLANWHFKKVHEKRAFKKLHKVLNNLIAFVI